MKLSRPLKVAAAVLLSLVTLTVVAAAFGVTVEDRGDGSGVAQAVKIQARLEPAAFPESFTAVPAKGDDKYYVGDGISVAEVRDVRVTTTLRNVGASENALIAAWRLPSIILAVAVVLLIWLIVKSVADGDPFNNVNVMRLRLIAGLLILAPVVRRLGIIARDELLSRSPIAGMPFDPAEWMFGPMIVGAALFVFSEAFAAGLRMRKDVEGLV